MYAARIGNDAVGVDFGGAGLQRGRVRAALLRIPNVQFIEADLRQLGTLGGRLGRFDQIICCETIEHIRDDKKLIADLSRLLKDGGRLLLTTPFKHYRRLLGDHVSQQEDGAHVRWGYTHDEMRSLFDACGLDVVTEEYVSGLVSQCLTNLTRILGKVDGRLAWAAVFPLRALQVLDAPVTQMTRYPSLSIGVVGRRRTFAV